MCQAGMEICEQHKKILGLTIVDMQREQKIQK